MSIVSKAVCRLRGHVQTGEVKITEAIIAEPGKEPRSVDFRYRETTCARCGRVLDFAPLGVVRDPLRDETL